MPANALDLCLAATVAGDLGIASDATVERVVTAASRAIASHCGRTFEKAAGIVEYPPSYDRTLLVLQRAPIVAITSIYEAGQLVDAADYESLGDHAAAGMVHRKTGRWMRTARDTGNLRPAWTDHAGLGGTDGVKVTYDAGWVTPGQNSLDAVTYPTVTLPEDLQEAAVLAATAFYRRLGRDPNIASESIGDYSVSFRDSASRLPADVIALLGAYAHVPVL